MKRALLIAIGGLWLWLLAACRAPEAVPALRTAPPPPAAAESQIQGPLRSEEAFLVRPAGPAGPTVVYHRPSGEPVWTLPAGRLAADGRSHVATTSDASDTLIRRYAPLTGRPEQLVSFAGRWELAAVSGNGRWAALTESEGAPVQTAGRSSPVAATRIQVVNLETGALLEPLILDGRFEIEAIDNLGGALFLIEHLGEGADAPYQVRVYDLAVDRLDPYPLRDKRFFDELMVGYAWGTVPSRDGRWLLTLYVNTQKNTPFIHLLNVRDRYSACIELPRGSGDPEAFKAYTMIVSPLGNKVFAANPRLGVVLTYSLMNFEITGVTNFAAAAGEIADLTQAGAASPDGRMVYFSYGRQIWPYDGKNQVVGAPILVEDEVVGLGVDETTRELLIAFRDGRMIRRPPDPGSSP